MSTIYVPLKYKKWEGAFDPHPLYGKPKLDAGESCGFLECYESVEKLRIEHPDAQYLQFEIDNAVAVR